MSDETTGAAGAVASEATPEPSPAPESTPEQAEGERTSPRSARQGVRELARQAAEAARARQGPARDAKGRFSRPDDTDTKDPETGEQPAAESQADPSADGKEGDADSPPAAEVAEGFKRIDLPEGHPLREQGRTFIDMPAETEEASRALVNSWTRRSDVDRANAAAQAAQQETVQLRRQVARLEAEAELRTSGELDKAVDPQLVALLQQAEQHGSPEQVKALQDAINAQRQAAINAKGSEAEQAAQDYETGAQFLRGVFEASPERYHLWYGQGEPGFRAQIAPIIAAYGRHVDQRMAQGGGGPDLNEFFGWVDQQYIRDPSVRAAVQRYNQEQQEAIRQQGEQAGREARDKELQAERREAAERHGRRPPSAPARAQRQGRAVADESDDSLRDARPGERHRLHRRRAGMLGRAFAAARKGR